MDHPAIAEAKRVLEVEAAAIVGLIDHLDQTFVDVVELINGSNGRVITMKQIVRALARQMMKQGMVPSASDFKQHHGSLT